LWLTEIPEVKKGKWRFRQLFVNGARRYRSRLPKKGFYRITELPGVDLAGPFDTPCKEFRFADKEIKSDWSNLNDVEVVVLHLWVDVHLPIAEVNEKERLVAFTRNSRRILTPEDSRYYVENVFEGLTNPGEWYLNRKTGRLYYKPKPNEDPATAEIVAPRLVSLVRFEGNPEEKNLVEYITLRGLTFSHNDWELPPDDAGDYQAANTVPGAIYGQGMRNCTIENCTVKNIGTYGIELSGGCQDNRLAHNEISEAGGGGIKISGGDAESPAYLRTGNTQVTDNHLHHLGQIYHSSVGILVQHSAGNNISHNHIHHLFYTGISVGWIWGYKTSVSQDNRIEFNHIHHIGQGLLSDMGGIYLLGVSPGTVVRNNLVHHVQAYGYGGWAIYPDEGNSHILIENNIGYDTSHTIFHQHYGRENIVRNNIFAFGKQGQIAYSKTEEHLGFTLQNNIILTNQQPFFVGGYNHKLTERKFLSDLNLFWDVKHKNPIFAKITERPLKLPAWQRLGYDLHSQIGNPKFKNYQKRNFRLTKSSPACKIGFQPIDLSQVGPRENCHLKCKRRHLRRPQIIGSDKSDPYKFPAKSVTCVVFPYSVLYSSTENGKIFLSFHFTYCLTHS